jgi:hypothetical protein
MHVQFGIVPFTLLLVSKCPESEPHRRTWMDLATAG